MRREIIYLKEGHSLIYQSLRRAEGVKELMTGCEFECIAEAVGNYIQGYHEMEDEIESLKDKNLKLKAEKKSLKAEKNPMVMMVTDTSMEQECKGLREEGLKALEMIKEQADEIKSLKADKVELQDEIGPLLEMQRLVGYKWCDDCEQWCISGDASECEECPEEEEEK